MVKYFLAVGNHLDGAWLQVVGDALKSLGKLHFASGQEALIQLKTQDYDLIVIDATTIGSNIAALVSKLHQERPNIPILVATTSPTWQRARQVFLAGAADYIRKSFDKEQILANCQEILKRSASCLPLQGDPEEDDYAYLNK